MKDFDMLVDKFIDQNRMYHWEGSKGIQNFEKLVRALGYNDHFGDMLREFLSDNSGAIEAMVEWIKDSRCQEWADTLAEQVCEDEDEEDDADEVERLKDEKNGVYPDKADIAN